jgi:trigger factor
MKVKEAAADRPVQDEDKVLCDVEMFLDKVPVEGGQNKDVAVIVGQGYFVPGFGKKLIGAKKGETREFSLPYPKDYHMANLAGKNVEFNVKVNEIYSREKPELNDEFAQSFGVKNMDELRQNIKKEMEQEKIKQVAEKAEIEMLDKILEKSEFGDIPETLLSQEVESMLQTLEQQVKSQGGNFDDYLSSIKKTKDQMKMDLAPEAIKRIKSALMIREIAVKEDIKVSKEEIDKRIEELIDQYKGYEKVEQRVKEPSYRDQLRNIMTHRKVIDKLREWNVEEDK